jgi:hypothetical protein
MPVFMSSVVFVCVIAAIITAIVFLVKRHRKNKEKMYGNS